MLAIFFNFVSGITVIIYAHGSNIHSVKQERNKVKQTCSLSLILQWKRPFDEIILQHSHVIFIQVFSVLEYKFH